MTPKVLTIPIILLEYMLCKANQSIELQNKTNFYKLQFSCKLYFLPVVKFYMAKNQSHISYCLYLFLGKLLKTFLTVYLKDAKVKI